MRRLVLVIGMFVSCVIIAPSWVGAVTDPVLVPNNKVGVHILETGEIEQAAKLVNSQGGDWGYVTIPIRSNDRDRDKWLKFFESCRKLHVIPILRLATYPISDTWERPDVYDLVDFANFLNEMPWPVKNRYIVLFNEINHSREWGGQVSPLEYATLLLDANRIFKSRSADFFLISAGLDMSAPTNKTSLDALEFLRQISRLQPKWYEAVDGLAVHAYPNPGFSSSVYSQTRYGIASYKYELQLLARLGYPSRPVFITETGAITENPFYSIAFPQIWTDAQIVAITPFLLFSADGDFAKFSLLDRNSQPTAKYRQIVSLPKIAGGPLLSDTLFVSATTAYVSTPSLAAVTQSVITTWETLWRQLKGQKTLQVGSGQFWVETADNDAKRQQGLSGRKQLPDAEGMLFIFPAPGKHTFWMKDMNFALDFVWIYHNQVVQISSHVLPPGETQGMPQVITPAQDVDAVLEVVAGSVDKYGITVGNKIERR